MMVSKQTEKFVECMRTMQRLYSQVYSALEEIYSYNDAEQIMADSFTVEYAALEKRVEQLMINSIKERMSDLNNTQEI